MKFSVIYLMYLALYSVKLLRTLPLHCSDLKVDSLCVYWDKWTQFQQIVYSPVLSSNHIISTLNFILGSSDGNRSSQALWQERSECPFCIQHWWNSFSQNCGNFESRNNTVYCGIKGSLGSMLPPRFQVVSRLYSLWWTNVIVVKSSSPQTFTTIETITNAKSARDWLLKVLKDVSQYLFYLNLSQHHVIGMYQTFVFFSLDFITLKAVTSVIFCLLKPTFVKKNNDWFFVTITCTYSVQCMYFRHL